MRIQFTKSIFCVPDLKKPALRAGMSLSSPLPAKKIAGKSPMNMKPNGKAWFLPHHLMLILRGAARTLIAASLLLAPLVGRCSDAGFYRTRQEADGRWWLVDPQGNKFVSKGVTTVLLEQDFIFGTKNCPYANAALAKYGTEDAWRAAVAGRLIGWNFNTLGAWSDPQIATIKSQGRHLAYTIDLGFSPFAAGRAKNGALWQKNSFPDVFDPEFEVLCQESAR